MVGIRLPAPHPSHTRDIFTFMPETPQAFYENSILLYLDGQKIFPVARSCVGCDLCVNSHSLCEVQDLPKGLHAVEL